MKKKGYSQLITKFPFRLCLEKCHRANVCDQLRPIVITRMTAVLVSISTPTVVRPTRIYVNCKHQGKHFIQFHHACPTQITHTHTQLTTTHTSLSHSNVFKELKNANPNVCLLFANLVCTYSNIQETYSSIAQIALIIT